jgi:hypothetical protein
MRSRIGRSEPDIVLRRQIVGVIAMDELQERVLEECADWADPSLTARVPIAEEVRRISVFQSYSKGTHCSMNP